MRKLLLIVCASIMALSVSAQDFKMLQTNIKPLSAKTLKLGDCKVVNAGDAKSRQDFAKVRANAKPVTASVDSQADLYGNYVEEDNYGEGLPDYGVATLAEYEANGTAYVNMVCLSEYIDALGTYDAATKKLTFQPQICYQDETWGKIALYGITAMSGTAITGIGDLTFTVGDDGVLKTDQIGVVLLGYEGTYKNKVFTGFTGVLSLIPSNAVQAGNIMDPEDATAAPEAYKLPVLVEDNATTITAKGFCASGALKINVNGDGTVSIPTKQEIAYLGLDNQIDIIEYGEYACFTGCTDGAVDYSKTSVPGTIKGNTITITEDFSVCSLTPQGGKPLSMGIFPAGTTITLDNGNYTSGIKDITTSREDAMKNAKAYNIMGQRVDANNAKGLIIVNGKKYLKK